jgi:Ca2+/Na+ antiporter
MFGKSFRPIAAVFIVVLLLLLIARNWLAAQWNMDYLVVLVGNTVLFVATAFSFYLYSKALRNNNPQVFLRMMYSSLLVKMVSILAATLLYLFVSKEINKAGIIASLALYVVYTYIEVKVLMRLSKNSPKNG